MHSPTPESGRRLRVPGGWSLLIVGLLLLPAPFLVIAHADGTGPLRPVERPAAPAVPDGATLGWLSGYIVENRGQVSSAEVRYYVEAGGLQIGFVPSGLVIELPDSHSSAPPSPSPSRVADEDGEPTAPGLSVIRIAFEGSNLVAPQGSGELPSRNNYLSGMDRSKWQMELHS